MNSTGTTQGKRRCAVCGDRAEVALMLERTSAWLCALHAGVARGIIPAPTSLHDLRAMFPLRVTARRARHSRAA